MRRHFIVLTESRFLAYLAQKKPKESVQLTVIREGKRQTVNLTLQWPRTFQTPVRSKVSRYL